MSDILQQIKKNIAKTRVVMTTPRIKRQISYVAIIDGNCEKEAMLAIPYDIIVSGIDAIKSATEIVSKMPSRAVQFVGAFYVTEEEKNAAQILYNTIKTRPQSDFISAETFIKLLRQSKTVGKQAFLHLGAREEYVTVEQFAKHIYPSAEIWHLGDALPRLHLLTQIWKPANPARLEELQIALYKNAMNPYVYRIHVSVDGDDGMDVLSKIPTDLQHKIVYVPFSGRLSYKGAFEYMKTLPVSDFAAVINTDIYFDDTIREAWNISFKNMCIALLRYESTVEYALNKGNAKKPQLFGPRTDSQDIWMFRVQDLKERHDAGESWAELDFRLGVPGCDNAIAGELLRRKWVVVNPAFSIHALHLHTSKDRNYTVIDCVSFGIYLLIHPCEISVE